MAEKKKAELTMDEAYAKLQEILEKMEHGSQGIEESFRLYEEGLNLVKYCNLKLTDIENRMIVLEGTEAQKNSTEEN